MGSGASKETKPKGKPAINGSAGGANNKKAIPPPSPPTTTKNEVFQLEKFEDVDQHALTAPSELLVSTFQELVKYLVKSPEHEDWDDIQKVRCLFRWMTSIDVFNLKSNDEPQLHSPLEYFFKIQQNQGNHAHLMSGLCQMANIPCVIISGMNKNASYEIGTKIDRKIMGAQWNAVHVGGNWRLVDGFWASACVVGKRSGEWTLVDADGNVMHEDEDESEGITQHRINEFYFFPEPNELIWTHFPDESKWQLLHKAISSDKFEKRVYIRERFHLLGMTLSSASKEECILNVKEEIELEFDLPPASGEKYKYKYMVYQSRQENEPEDSKEVHLDRFVMYEHAEKKLRFRLRFPITGKFRMDVFGVDEEGADIFDLVCTYVLVCKEKMKNCLPLPDCPAIGWGPGAELKKAGLTTKSHDGAVIVTEDGNVEIRLESKVDVELHQMLKNALIDEATLSNYVITQADDGEYIIQIRLPQGGEYALKMYANGEGNDGEAPNVLNYLIQCKNKNIHNTAFPNLATGTLGKNPIADTLGVKALNHTGGNIQAADGTATVNFEAPDNVELLCELHSADSDAVSYMKVETRQEDGKWVFDLDMPKEGEYSVNVFARNKGDDARVYSVHSYLVNSGGHEFDRDAYETKEDADIVAKIPTETVQTSDNEVLIPLPADMENVTTSLHRRNANDPPDPNQVKIVDQGGKKFVHATLNEYGEYMMNLYAHNKDGTVTGCAKYHLSKKPEAELYQDETKVIMDNIKDGDDDSRDEEEETFTPAPPKAGETEEEKQKRLEEEQLKSARKMIKRSMELKDMGMLEKAIATVEKLGADLENDELLGKAKQMLELFKAKENLMLATQKGDLQELTSAIKAAEAVNFNNQLDLQIALAARLKDRLQRIEKLKHSVLSMDQKTVAELKTYSNPPDGVHQSLMATFLILGHPLKDVKNWRTCQALLSKTGKEGVMRRIGQFQPKDGNAKMAAQAKSILEPYSREQIRDVSAGAATFYLWSLGMIEEVYGSS
ncbi:hypothetical protein ScPMuIL_001992 [Solemya velum]